MLAAREVEVRAGDARLLARVSAALAPGELVCVIGPNGAGKSTLLDVLCGVRRPDAGSVSLDGRRLAGIPPLALARRRAVLPQASPLGFPLTVLEVVLLGRMPWAGHSDRATDLACVEAALAATDTTHLAERRYPTLSGGERQRVQLARVLAQVGYGAGDGSLAGRHLLLDEPTAALDLAHQQACLRVARRIAGAGGGVLAVVHDPNLALLHADRVLLLCAGQVVADGPPERVITPSSLRRVFGVEAAVARHPHVERHHVVLL